MSKAWKAPGELPPSGVELCRRYDLPNRGPRAPAVGVRARDHQPPPARQCEHHERTTHGGNQRAFYVQCVTCRWHIEFYPRAGAERAPAMTEVEKDLEAIKKKKNQKGKPAGPPPAPKSNRDEEQVPRPAGPAPQPRRRGTPAPRAPPASPPTSPEQVPSTPAPRHPSRRVPPPEEEEEGIPGPEHSVAPPQARTSRQSQARSSQWQRVEHERTRSTRWEKGGAEEFALTDSELSDAPSPAVAPEDPTSKIAAALAAVRALAATPGATNETWQLLQGLEAHLGVAAGAAGAQEEPPQESRATSSTTPT